MTTEGVDVDDERLRGLAAVAVVFSVVSFVAVAAAVRSGVPDAGPAAYLLIIVAFVCAALAVVAGRLWIRNSDTAAEASAAFYAVGFGFFGTASVVYFSVGGYVSSGLFGAMGLANAVYLYAAYRDEPEEAQA